MYIGIHRGYNPVIGTQIGTLSDAEEAEAAAAEQREKQIEFLVSASVYELAVEPGFSGDVVGTLPHHFIIFATSDQFEDFFEKNFDHLSHQGK